MYDLETLKKYDVDNVMASMANGMVPSVTSILSIIRQEHLEHWFIRKCVERYIQTGEFAASVEYRDTSSAQFGTTAHSLIQAHLMSTACQTLHDESHVRAVQPLFKWIDQNVAEVLFCEQPFANKELGYGGTADFLFRLNDGRLLLGDAKFKKRSSKFEMLPDILYKYQLSAYRQHFRREYGDMDIANFLLASPLGSAKYPLLRLYNYGENDWTAGFTAAQRLWIDQFFG